jgi:ubiquinone/menaquinone biosynthesis C-methylase UbiE
VIAAMETPHIETASDAYAQRFAGEAGRYLLASQEAAVRAVLADWRGGRVLDVGGGNGQLTPFLQKRASELVVLGSDARGVKRVRRDFAGRAAATGDLLDLPFAPRSFDAVVAVRVLPLVREWQRVLAELCRVARSTVVVEYPRPSGLHGLKQLERGTRSFRNFRDAEIAELLSACGFAPRARRAQALLPMLVHRRANGATLVRGVERTAKLLGLTQAFGSPVVVRADRREP